MSSGGGSSSRQHHGENEHLELSSYSSGSSSTADRANARKLLLNYSVNEKAYAKCFEVNDTRKVDNGTGSVSFTVYKVTYRVSNAQIKFMIDHKGLERIKIGPA